MSALDLLPERRSDLQEIAETVDFMEVVKQPKKDNPHFIEANTKGMRNTSGF